MERIGKRITLAAAVEQARANWQAKNGKCAACAVGDKPENGLHRGQHPCGNEQACAICTGCLPPGEQCKACGRINKRGNERS